MRAFNSPNFSSFQDPSVALGLSQPYFEFSDNLDGPGGLCIIQMPTILLRL